MADSGSEFTTMLVMAYKLLEFIQSIITQSSDFSIKGIGRRKSVKLLKF